MSIKTTTVAQIVAFVVSAGICVMRARAAWHDYRNWLDSANDRSSQEAYQTFLMVDGGVAVLTGAVALVLLWLVVRRRRALAAR